MNNLPDGTYEGDPRAPWNRRDPWDNRKCAECKYFGKVKARWGACESSCCSFYPATGEGMDVLDVLPTYSACEAWEER